MTRYRNRGSIKIYSLVCGIILGTAWFYNIQAQELGRLFTTPQERQIMNANRNRNNPQQTEPTVSNVPQMSISNTPSNYKLDGVLIRQDGKKTIWVNKNNSPNKSEVKNLTANNDTDTDTPLKIRMHEGKKEFQLKPGQIYDPASKSIREAYESHGLTTNTRSVECNRRIKDDSLSELICTKKLR